MRKKSTLTPVEWEIMESVWSLGKKPSVREVLDHAFPNGEKAYTTVQTIMNTLVKKGLLRREKIGLVNFYKPTRPRSALVNSEMRSLASRVFGGSIPALANSLLSLDGLRLDEIEQIKQLLAEKEQQLRSEES